MNVMRYPPLPIEGLGNSNPFAYAGNLLRKSHDVFMGLGFMGILSLSLFIFFSLLKDEGSDHYLYFYLWLINIATFLLLLSRLDLIVKYPVKVIKKISLKETIILICILFFAFGVRFLFPERAPGNIEGDEMTQALASWKFAEGESKDIFGTNEWYYTPNFYYFSASPFFRFFGKSVGSWRLSSAVFGTATILLSFIFFSLIFNKRVGFFASLLLSVYHLHIHFSRIGNHQVTDAFWLMLISLSFFLALRTQRLFLFGATGIFLAISQNFYFGARIILAIIAVVLFFCAAEEIKRKRLLKLPGKILILFLGFYIGFNPFLARYIKNPQTYGSRINQVSFNWLKEVRSQEGLLKNSLKSVKQTAGAFLTGPSRQWYSPDYPIVNRLAFIFFVVGMAITMRRILIREYFYLFCSFFIPMSVITFLIEDPPAAQRMVLVAPAITAFVAIGIDWFLQNLKRVSKANLAKGSVLVVLSFIILADLYQYFLVYVPERDDRFSNNLVTTEMARKLENTPTGTKVYFYGSDRLWFYSFSTLRFVTPNVTGIDIGKTEKVKGVNNFQDKIFIALPERVNDFMEDVKNFSIPGAVYALEFRPPKTLADRIKYYYKWDDILWVKIDTLGATGNHPLYIFIPFYDPELMRF